MNAGSPWENGYCESFNSKRRDEFLSLEFFYSMKELRVLGRALVHTLQYHQSALFAALKATGTRGVPSFPAQTYRHLNSEIAAPH